MLLKWKINTKIQSGKLAKFNTKTKRFGHSDLYVFPENLIEKKKKEKIERERNKNKEMHLSKLKPRFKMTQFDNALLNERHVIKAGFVPQNAKMVKVSIVGFPNSGKSTFVNRVLGRKIAPVSSKEQTTRENLLGIMTTEENIQLAFIDTPGLIPVPEAHKIPRNVVLSAWESLKEVDVVLFVVDAVKSFNKDMSFTLDRLKLAKERYPDLQFYLVMNKIDLLPSVKRTLIYEPIERFEYIYPDWKQIFSDYFIISALTGHRVLTLVNHIKDIALPKKWEYNPEMITDISDYKVAKEIIRQAFYRRYNNELPYSVEFKIDGWTPVIDNAVRVDVVILVEKKSQIGMIIGPKGSQIRALIGEAEAEISNQLNLQIELKIAIRVHK